jgi:hypothetical protein
MRIKIASLAFLASIGVANAATCNLMIGSESLWHGQCHVTFNADGLHAEAHDYRCHSAGGPNKCTSAQACAGPWLDIFKGSGDEDYSSYWSIGGGCHADSPTIDHISKTGPGAYSGQGYTFTVK